MDKCTCIYHHSRYESHDTATSVVMGRHNTRPVLIWHLLCVHRCNPWDWAAAERLIQSSHVKVDSQKPILHRVVCEDWKCVEPDWSECSPTNTRDKIIYLITQTHIYIYIPQLVPSLFLHRHLELACIPEYCVLSVEKTIRAWELATHTTHDIFTPIRLGGIFSL